MGSGRSHSRVPLPYNSAVHKSPEHDRGHSRKKLFPRRPIYRMFRLFATRLSDAGFMKNARERLPGGLPFFFVAFAFDNSAPSSALVLYKRSTRPFNYAMNTSLLSRIDALSLLCASSDGRNRLSANLGYFGPRWTSSVASGCPGSNQKRRNPMTLYSHDITQRRQNQQGFSTMLPENFWTASRSGVS